MAKYRSVQTSFWNDAKIIDDFTPKDRYFYLYLLTNQKSNQIGCYELPIKQICRDTGYNEETVIKLLDRFQNVLKVTNYDFKTKEILLKNWYKYNWLNSDTTKVCIENEFSLIKSSILKDLISPMYGAYIPHGGNKKKKKKKKKKNSENEFSQNSDYVAPTLADIFDYSLSKGIDDMDYCEKFYEHYEAIGWVNGSGQKIKNWKLVFNRWIKGDKKDVVEESFIDEAGFIHKDGRRRF